MKVLLTEEIEKLGIVGDVVEVKPGFARNYLLPRGLALPVTPHNVALMERRKVRYLKELETLRQKAESLKETLEGRVFEFQRKAGENGVLFGSVTTHDIESRLQEEGFEVDRKRMNLPEAVKKLGDFVCEFKLHPEVTAELRIRVAPEGELERVSLEEEEAPAAAVATEAAEPGPDEASVEAAPPPEADSAEEPQTEESKED